MRGMLSEKLVFVLLCCIEIVWLLQDKMGDMIMKKGVIQFINVVNYVMLDIWYCYCLWE